MTPQDINANYIADLYGETYLAEDMATPKRRLAVSTLFPGFVVVAIASAAATWFSEHYGMPVILAGLLLGLALNFVSAEQKVHPGLDFCGTSCLRWGIVLLGTQVTAMQIGSLGAVAFLGLVAIMALVIGAGLIGARLGGQSNLSGWLAVPPRFAAHRLHLPSTLSLAANGSTRRNSPSRWSALRSPARLRCHSIRLSPRISNLPTNRPVS